MEKKNVKNENVDVDIRLLYGQECKYDPLKDVQKLVPDLGVDIDDMLQTGIVKDAGTELDNNGIDSPDNIIGRIRDTFDAMDAARVIKKYGKKNPAKVNAEVQNLSQNSSNEPIQ